jgi:branched-chain amino acid transport system substrate-binding protein
MMRRIGLLWVLLGGLLGLPGAPALAADAGGAIVIGITAEYGQQGSHTGQSIEKGILLAIDEINAAGGVLGGRKLALERKDDRGVPARGVENFSEFAANPAVVGVFCGRYSPVALEVAPVANRLGLLLLDPWAAADGITRHPAPSYVFRLSLIDSWAIGAMIEHASKKGLRRFALFVPNNAWGRSSEQAAQRYVSRRPELKYETTWYNWGDTNFSEKLGAAVQQGVQGLLLVSNEAEGAFIVQQMAALPKNKRLPIISHWGVTGGDFVAAVGDALWDVDFVVVQSFTFNGPQNARTKAVASGVKRLFGQEANELRAQVGFAHAYDFTHLLALAIRKAGSADRAKVREALEHLGTYDGLLRRYQRPFAAGQHEALDARAAFLARFEKDGSMRAVRGN